MGSFRALSTAILWPSRYLVSLLNELLDLLSGNLDAVLDVDGVDLVDGESAIAVLVGLPEGLDHAVALLAIAHAVLKKKWASCLCFVYKNWRHGATKNILM